MRFQLFLKVGYRAALVMIGAFCVQSAFASTSVPVVTVPSNAATILAVSVSGFIAPHCAATQPQGAYSFGELLNTGNGEALNRTLLLPVTLSCNSPFQASVTSQNGGLAFEGDSAKGFNSLISYAMHLDLAAVGGSTLDCESGQMRAEGRETSSACSKLTQIDNGLAEGSASIRLTTKAGGLPLLMGRYSDIVVLKLSPKLGD